MCFGGIAGAQYYNPYMNPYMQQQANQQAYQMGQQMAQQMMDEYNNNPANAPVITGQALDQVAKAFMRNDPQEAYDDAFERLKHAGYGLDYPNAVYWMGVLAECDLVTGEDYRDALRYYRSAADDGNTNARQRLRQLNNGASTYDQDEVLSALRQMSLMASSASLPSMSSSSGSGSSTSSGSCPYCNGSGVDRIAWDGTNINTTGTPIAYRNYDGRDCPYCDRYDNHYHLRCVSSYHNH